MRACSHSLVLLASLLLVADSQNAIFRRGTVIQLAHGEETCFYTEFNGTQPYTFEYAVLKGGNLDVDARALGPAGEQLYQGERRKRDRFSFDTLPGEMGFCFSNKMSRLSQKKVYFTLNPKFHNQLAVELGDLRPRAMSLAESEIEGIHSALLNLMKQQSDYRVREHIGSALAISLQEQVTRLFLAYLIGIALVGLGQTMLLKSFFTHNKTCGDKPVRPRV